MAHPDGWVPVFAVVAEPDPRSGAAIGSMTMLTLSRDDAEADLVSLRSLYPNASLRVIDLLASPATAESIRRYDAHG